MHAKYEAFKTPIILPHIFSKLVTLLRVQQLPNIDTEHGLRLPTSIHKSWNFTPDALDEHEVV